MIESESIFKCKYIVGSKMSKREIYSFRCNQIAFQRRICEMYMLFSFYISCANKMNSSHEMKLELGDATNVIKVRLY